MKRSKHKKEPAHKTFRILPATTAKLRLYAQTTGWSEAKVVNHLLQASLDHLNGNAKAMQNLQGVINSAEALELARQKQELILAPLKKKAAEARRALQPLVQKIAQAKGTQAKKAA